MDWIVEASAEAARNVWGQLMRERGCGPVRYLYFKRGAVMFAGEETPEGFELATGERCPIDRTRDQLIAWTLKIARACPCLPEDTKEGA